MPAILGKKIGMTRVFDDQGRMVPVTVIEAGPCVVVQRKTTATDGYEAIQVGFEDRKRQRLNSPLLGHFQTRNISPKRYLRELPVKPEQELNTGDELRVEMFSKGDEIVIQGRSKGKGFAGGMKRHHFRGGPMEHGASKVHRKPMSAGGTDAARVFPGMRGPGHMGDAIVTQKGLHVVEVDADRNLLIVKGTVPGANGGLLIIQSRERA